MLCLLTAGPATTMELARWLDCTESTARRNLHRLQAAGLISSRAGTHRLTEAPLLALLHEAAAVLRNAGGGANRSTSST